MQLWQAKQPNYRVFCTDLVSRRGCVAAKDIDTALRALDASVQRVKGWVETDAGVLQVDKVGANVAIKRLEQDAKPNILGLVFIFYVDQNSRMQGNPLTDWEWTKTAS